MIDRRSPIKDHGRAFKVLAATVDSMSVLASGFIALAIIQPGMPFSLIPNRYFVLVFVAVVVMFAIFNARGVYDSWRGRSSGRLLQAVAFSWVLAALIVLAIVAASGQYDNFPVNWFFWWAGISLFFLLFARVVAFGILRIARARGWNRKRVVIVGAGVLGKDLLHRVRANPWSGFEVTAFFDDNPPRDNSSIEGIEVKHLTENLDTFVSDLGVAEVWIALPLQAEERLKQVLVMLRHSTANIRYVPNFFNYSLLNHAITHIAGRGMIDLSSSPMQGFNRILKGTEDYVLSAILLFLLGPLMLILAIGVKLSSPGPVFYKQERVSWNGNRFSMLKFRSMRNDAETNGVEWGKAKAKPITPFGAFLRRTSLDELPQLINVLRGEMSVVGPRPERSVFVEQFKEEIPKYMLKHLVKAGITGWAQVNGLRGDTDLKERIEYDIYYIENWSLWLDFKIILLTFLRGLTHRNAR